MANLNKFKEEFQKLSTKEQKELLTDLSSMQGTQEVKWAELNNNLKATESTETMKKPQLESNEKRVKLNQTVTRELEKKQATTDKKWEESIENAEKTFCGIDRAELTDNQKILFDRLTPVQREELSQKVSINKAKGQIEFPQAKLAIKDADTATNVTKSSADDAIKKLWNGWKLPGDVDYNDSNRLTLDPKNSDYDAMILQMPWSTDDKKVENFRLLTEMYWRYRTSKSYNKSSSSFVFRRFDGYGWDRNWNFDYYYYLVRPVRSL